MSKTLKVSDATYEKVHKVAEEKDISITKAADTLLSGNVDAVELAIKDLANDEKVKDLFDGILRRQLDGVAYYCKNCNGLLDEDEEPEKCPHCGTKLQWSEVPKEKTSWLGWGLAGLLLWSLLGKLSGSTKA